MLSCMPGCFGFLGFLGCPSWSPGNFRALRHVQGADLFHALDNEHAEGAAVLTAATGNAVLGISGQGLILGHNGLRHCVLHDGKIVELFTMATPMPLGQGAQWPQ